MDTKQGCTNSLGNKYMMIETKKYNQLQKRIKKLYAGDLSPESRLNGYKVVTDSLRKRIEELRAELDKHRWIPVTERLPEMLSKEKGWSKTVLVFGGGKVGLAWFVGKCYNNPKDNYDYWASDFHTSDTFPETITHWKPIYLS